MRLTRVPGWLAVLLLLHAAPAHPADRRLPDAAKERDWTTVRMLLEAPADVNGRQPDGATALHWAVHWDDVATVELLLRAGADANATNDFGVTPLHLAATNANLATAAALLAGGARPDAALPTGETPLMTAARTGSAGLVAKLLANGATVNAREAAQGQTALMWAVAQQHAPVVRVLLEHGADVHARTQSGFTPMLFAARVGDVAIAEQLRRAGANVSDTAKDGASALLVAAVRGHVDLARFLLEHGADPNAGPGYTPLHWAAGSWETELSGPRGVRIERHDEWRGLRGPETGRLDLVRALLAHGADPNARLAKAPPRVGFTVFASGRLTNATPFFIAAMSGLADVMQLLADAGADPTLMTADGTTPLMAASGVGRVLAESRVTHEASLAAARLAAELGADVNATNAAGDTALHGAAHIRADALVQFLADRGAVLDVKNRRGETPLMVAERTIAAGSAPVYIRTSTGDLLRQLAARRR
jgi:ankyrin repeat protein